MSKTGLLEWISYTLLLGYALVSCWGMDRLPAGFVSIAGLVFLARFALAPYRPHFYGGLLKPFFVFLAAAVLSTLACWPNLAWDPAWSFVDRMLTFPIAVLVCRSRWRVLGLTGALAVSAIVVSVVALLQAGQPGIDRLRGFFGHPVHLGEHLLLVLAFFLPLAFSLRQPRPLRGFAGLTLCLAAAALLFNATRAAWIAASLVLLLYLWFTLRSRRTRVRRSVLAALLVLTLACAGVFALSPWLQARLASVTDLNYQSNSERLIIWQAAAAMIGDQPLLGVGPDNFGPQYRERYIRPEAKERFQRDAHNSYLSIAAELGIVGLVAFLFLLLSLFRFFHGRLRTAVEPEWALGALFCLTAFCVYGLMNSMINTFWAVRLLCLCLGIALAGDLLSRRA